MEFRWPRWPIRLFGDKNMSMKLNLSDAFRDMPEGLKQFLVYCLLFLVGGISLLFILALATMY